MYASEVVNKMARLTGLAKVHYKLAIAVICVLTCIDAMMDPASAQSGGLYVRQSREWRSCFDRRKQSTDVLSQSRTHTPRTRPPCPSVTSP